MDVGIKGFGAYAPENIVDNAYFEQFLETSDGALVKLPNKSRVYPSSKTDKLYGVEEEIFFKDGFCNKKKRNQEKLSIISLSVLLGR